MVDQRQLLPRHLSDMIVPNATADRVQHNPLETMVILHRPIRASDASQGWHLLTGQTQVFRRQRLRKKVQLIMHLTGSSCVRSWQPMSKPVNPRPLPVSSPADHLKSQLQRISNPQASEQNALTRTPDRRHARCCHPLIWSNATAWFSRVRKTIPNTKAV